MRYAIASNQDRVFSLLFSLVVGVLFALGFLSTSQSLYTYFSPWIPKAPYPWSELKEMAFFPLLAGLFALSMPKRPSLQRSSTSGLLKMSIFPILIAFVFGRTIGNEWHWDFSKNLVNTVWYLVFIPLGEECLFRGWLYGILERVWPGKTFTVTNPLPLAVWGSAIAFSVWHLQNFGSSSVPLVALQIVYTLATGLWLGVLRHRSQSLLPGILAHSFINLSAGI